WERGAAAAVAEMLRADVAALQVPVRNGTLRLTCSIGVSEWASGDTIDSLLARADIALYSAKASGRNRVEIADMPHAMPQEDCEPAGCEGSPDDDLEEVYNELAGAVGA